MERTRRLLKFFKSLKVRIWKVNNTYQCSISLLTERKTVVLRLLLLISSQRTLVPVLSTALQVLVKKITRSVSVRESSIQMTHQCQLMRMESSQMNVQLMRVFMSRTLTRSLLRTLSKKEELSKVEQRFITILIVGEVTLP